MMHRLLSIDNQLFREGLKRLLVGTDFQLAGEADNLGDAFCWLKEQLESDRRSDLIATALDDAQPIDNVEWLRQFRGLVPNVRILVLANTSRPVPLSSDLLSQIDGYLSKDVSAEILLHSLQLMVLGQQVLPGSLEPPQVQATPPTQRSPGVVRPGALSPREAEIMRLIVSGHSN
jgi:two-component system, NarL family, nitrate/nitrite response regulator NarL